MTQRPRATPGRDSTNRGDARPRSPVATPTTPNTRSKAEDSAYDQAETRTAAANSQLTRRNTNGEGGISRQRPSQHTPTVRGPAVTQPPGASDSRMPQHTDDGMECGGDEMPPTDQCQTCAWVWPSNPHTSGRPYPACGATMMTIAPTDLTHALQLLPTKCPSARQPGCRVRPAIMRRSH